MSWGIFHGGGVHLGAGQLASSPNRWGRRSAAPWDDREPIRSEIFGPERFEQHAVSLADSQTVVQRSRPVVPLLTRLGEDADSLARSYSALVADLERGHVITPAAEWLVDNFHIVEEQIRQIRQDLPGSYFRQLPKLGAGFLEGHPRIFGVVWAYVAHTDSLFDPDLLARYIRAYEGRKALTLGELWAVAITLRLILIENLRRIADRVVAASADRLRADQLADSLRDAPGAPRAEVDRRFAAAVVGRPSRALAVQLIRRLSGDQESVAMRAFGEHLAGIGMDPDQLVLEEHQAQASATVTMRNIITSLRLISDLNWEDWVESVSLIEDDLRSNPGYAALDFYTRNLYRSAIEELARGAGQEEIDVARVALYRAAHGADAVQRDLGYWLVDDGFTEFAAAVGYRAGLRRRLVDFGTSLGLAGYLGSLTLVVAVLLLVVVWGIDALAGGMSWQLRALVAALAALPVSDLGLAVVNYGSAKLFPASVLPGLALRDGIPDSLRTLVAIPTMLTSQQAVEDLLAQVEVHYLANTSGEIYFALVTDWPDSPVQRSQADDDLLEAAQLGIRELNARHGERFFLMHRERRFNPAEGVWMGWERKRGKLDELNRMLRGDDDTSFVLVEGRTPGPFRYVLTLDSDTRLPRESARRLVGKIAHPLNRAVFDPAAGRVVRGYGILQPRVSPSLPMSEGSSPFQRVYSTQRGLDPYAFAVSDVYQDLFDEGSFAGKGIYDIDAVMTALDSRVPENAVLSHDLLEGNYARSGLVTDVEVVEEYPLSYEVAAARTHRWTRGDWQLLPWLTTRRAGLSPLGLWKMGDNLRRSLSPILLVAGLVVTSAVLPAAASAGWLALIVLVNVVPPLLPLFSRLFVRRVDVTWSSQLRGFAEDLRSGLLLAAFNIVLLGHQAWLNLDAVVRTLTRLARRRRLLEWTTAAAAANRAVGTLGRYAALMWGGFVPALAVLVLGVVRGDGHLAVAVGPASVWFLAPVVAYAASRISIVHQATASTESVAALRLVARRTWNFFATFVTERENNLPPDNFQEHPTPVVAPRTSPTNIGLYLLTVATAYDFGWIGRTEAVERLESTLETVQRLETYRGHLLNWYDTRSLAPLEPRYVSTVDSGNLAGHLITLAGTCRDWVHGHGPAGRRARGLRDAVALIRESLQRLDPETRHDEPATGCLRLVDELAARLGQLDGADQLDDELAELLERIDAVSAATAALPPGDGRDEVQMWCAALRTSTESLDRDRGMDDDERELLDKRLLSIADTATALMSQMHFDFLYDQRRGLLAVGYQVAQQKLDDSCYDLLASEARLASYVAIAKGDIRTRHWFMLGRRVAAVAKGAALLSWSGSMFEYLMPPLVMRSPDTGLLGRTCQLVVRRQMAYAAKLDIPWGISESAYNARDVHLTYQYSPFGVPGLGIVRGLGDNVVVAPYATGLAAMVDPSAAADNYTVLERLGASGRYGFYEALDFTPARVPTGDRYAIVRCFMAHHQGMTVVAINNVVHDGVMRDRFHDEPMIEAAELLLQERAPREVPVSYAPRHELDTSRGVRGFAPPVDRHFVGSQALQPGLHVMSNGRLSLTLTPAGGGQIRWLGTAITRWHPDVSAEEAGDLVYLRDEASGRVWSATPMPIPSQSGSYEVRFAEDRAEYTRQRGPIESTLEYRISPESDAVVRRLTLRNRRPRTRRLTVTSYAELVLGKIADDDAHPAFSKMFVHTEFLPERGAIVATRRRRSPSDPEIWAGHMIYVSEGPAAAGPTAETDRRAFLGRGGTVRAPASLSRPPRRRGSTGYVMDPVFSLSQRLRLRGDQLVHVYLWTFAAGSRAEIIQLIDQHRSDTAYDRVTLLSWTQSQVQLRHLGVSADEASVFQALAGHVVHPHPALRPAESVLLRDAGPQSQLWPLSISGDLPIVLVHIDDEADLPVVRQLIRAFEFWRSRRFAVDLVIVNDRAHSYVQELHQSLEAVAASIRPRTGSPDSTGRIFVVRRDQAPADTIRALTACARVVLSARAGDLAAQLPTAGLDVAGPPMLPATARAALELSRARTVPLAPFEPGETLFFNGYGGFTADGGEYLVVLDEGAPTPAPWTNVVANADFGFHATAEGGGYTWWRNSRDNQLTPWRNDPVTVPLSEAIYVRDEATGRIASPTASPIDAGRHLAYHGFGYTRYEHDTEELHLELVQFVPGEDPVKLSWLRVSNRTGETRAVTVSAYAEVLLGINRATTALHLQSQVDASRALFVRNPWSTQFPDQVVFFDLAGRQDSYTADRTEFLGRQGSLAMPRAVLSGEPLANRVGAGFDPCAAMQQRLVIPPGETRTVLVAFGAARDAGGAQQLVARYRHADPAELLAAVRQRWRQRLGAIQVHTPNPSFDLMMNGWLLYQTMACRMLARSGYYQTSGAYGFRDQLQDSMALSLVDPAVARRHLLVAAGRQFVEGDVQHWWLPASGAGVRTRITDDVVWLAHAVARYVTLTGDIGVLDEQVAYLEGPVLTPEQHESFFEPAASKQFDTLYDHCVRGLERAFTAGRHGLPLIGTGDWNDGMNRVGSAGRGESVWLGWFLHSTLTDFIQVALRRGDREVAARYWAEQGRLLRALEAHGWDGSWYRRGYFDDGTPLGSAGSSECTIDAIAQSWAVLSGACDPARAVQAMSEMDRRLVIEDPGVVRLFTPPFDVSEPDPGYIRSYPPGVRENGGQYTHGAMWSIFAFARMDRQDRAGALFDLVNPITHARTRAGAQTYRVEPYVVAADVYSVAPYLGRGGWTWYTGSSGWMYRAGFEAILGLRRQGNELAIRPCLPPEWTQASVDYDVGATRYRITFRAGERWPRRVISLDLDGLTLSPDSPVPLVQDGRLHEVTVTLGPRES